MCGGIVLIGLGTRGEGFRTGLETTFPGTEIPQKVGGLRMPLDIEQQLPVFLRRLPARRRDVDKAQFAQLLDKILTSSSSMKRLILRMASSYPGICTFSYKFTF